MAQNLTKTIDIPAIDDFLKGITVFEGDMRVLKKMIADHAVGVDAYNKKETPVIAQLLYAVLCLYSYRKMQDPSLSPITQLYNTELNNLCEIRQQIRSKTTVLGKIDEILLNLTAPMRLLAEEVKGTITLLQKLQEKRSAAAAKGKDTTVAARDCRDAQQKLGHQVEELEHRIQDYEIYRVSNLMVILQEITNIELFCAARTLEANSRVSRKANELDPEVVAQESLDKIHRALHFINQDGQIVNAPVEPLNKPEAPEDSNPKPVLNQPGAVPN